MRFFILAFALILPVAFIGCAESPQNDVIEDDASAGDMEDVATDANVVDEPMETEVNLFADADTDGDGMLNADELMAAWPDADIAVYDTDGDGMVSEDEFHAQMEMHPEM